MAAIYEKHGLRFLYPENWQITDEEMRQLPLSVSAQSPGSGFWSITVHGSDDPPEDLATEVMQVLKQEYEVLDAVRIEQDLGPARAIGYDVNFFYLDLVITAKIRSFPWQQHHVVVLCQAENREFDRLEQVFLAITMSLQQQSELA